MLPVVKISIPYFPFLVSLFFLWLSLVNKADNIDKFTSCKRRPKQEQIYDKCRVNSSILRFFTLLENNEGVNYKFTDTSLSLRPSFLILNNYLTHKTSRKSLLRFKNWEWEFDLSSNPPPRTLFLSLCV